MSAPFVSLSHYCAFLLWHTAVSQRVIGSANHNSLFHHDRPPVSASDPSQEGELAAFFIFRTWLHTFQYFLALLLFALGIGIEWLTTLDSVPLLGNI